MTDPASTFLYYLPRCVICDAEELVRRGLADRLAETVCADELRSTLQRSNVTGGPDGGDGKLLVPMPSDRSIPVGAKYDAAAQTWRASARIIDGRPAYWVGWYTDAPPNPRGVRRFEMVDGYDEILGDGRDWICPTIRSQLTLPGVPCALGRWNGSYTSEPLPRYQAIWKQSQVWLAAWLSAPGLGIEAQLEAAFDCLRLNYRIGHEEITALGLLTTETCGLVVEAALDLPFLEAAVAPGADGQKKNTAAHVLRELQSIAHGRTDDSPTTDRPEPI